MAGVNAFLRRFRRRKRKQLPPPDPTWPGEATEREKQLVAKFAPYTMTGPLSRWSLLKATEYVDRQGISGAIVECGVWRGGNMMMVKEARRDRHPRREIFLFDTFAGMSWPTEADVSAGGMIALDKVRKRQRSGHNDWCYASIDEVRQAFEQFGLLDSDVHFRMGKVEDTLADASALPERIALLRLDTDWYESTKIELEALYPRLQPGGVLIIDDYGHWEGARLAVDEYFGENLPMLVPVDHSCRFAVRR
jgi:hypothetical protein